MTTRFRTRLPQPRVIAGAALRAARIARRPARLLRLHRLHRARRDGDCRRRLGGGKPQRRLDARGPHAARRRRRVLADPARSQAGGNRLPARARPGFGRGDVARRWPAAATASWRWSNSRRSTATIRCSGELTLDPKMPMADLLAERDGAFGAAVDSTLLARLDLKLGDRVTHRQCHASRSAAWSAPSRTSSPAMSASARAFWSAKRACAPPACCSPAAWCAGSTASSCRTMRPTIAPRPS